MGSASETTERKQSGLIPFKPGQSGNPAGRPKGARHKLGTAFLEQMLADFEQHGKQVIEDVRKDKPDQYLKVIASILPKEIDASVEITTTTKEQRDAAVSAFQRAIQETIQ